MKRGVLIRCHWQALQHMLLSRWGAWWQTARSRTSNGFWRRVCSSSLRGSRPRIDTARMRWKESKLFATVSWRLAVLESKKPRQIPGHLAISREWWIDWPWSLVGMRTRCKGISWLDAFQSLPRMSLMKHCISDCCCTIWTAWRRYWRLDLWKTLTSPRRARS